MTFFQPRLSGTARFAFAVAAVGFLGVMPRPAQAIPSFATQTGQPCSACHVGAFGPQLTPFGREFKLNGYTMTDGNKHGLPLSLMLSSSFTNTQKDQASAPAPGFGTNNNFSLDQISAFYGGPITSNIGAFVQTTYDGVNSVFHWDNADIRYGRSGTVFGKDYVVGMSINNNPTSQDLWNSTPAWRFPYSASAVAPTPASSTLIDGGLAQQVLGATAFASFNNLAYVEAGAYHGLGGNVRNALGVVPVSGTDTYDGLLPYWRVALEHDFDGAHYFQIGTFGIVADKNPGNDQTTGLTDHLADNAVDANYQWHANPDHIVSAHAVYIHEDQKLNATYALGNSDNQNDYLNTFRADVSYSYKNTYTPSIQYFKTTGSTDATLLGTANGKPDSEGIVAELAYVPFGKPDSPFPWFNGRVALQYVAYTQFDGATSHASDNNTLFLNLWLTLDPVAPFYGSGAGK